MTMEAEGHTDTATSVGSTDAEPAGSEAEPRLNAGVTPGMVLGGRYEVGRPLGMGGAGRVFEAFDRVLSERVALKVLREDRAGDRSWIRRLAREVKVARLVRHPNVCRVFELGHDGGVWFVTMELAERGALRDMVRPHRQAQDRGAPADPAPQSW